jgi:thiamine biosynthesis lipoprotein
MNSKPLNRICSFFIICALTLGFFTSGCQNQNLYTDKRIMMGTFVEVISSESRAANIAFAEIQRIENILSKYKEDSGVSKLNKYSQIKASPELFYLIKKSLDFWQVSFGAFDITVAPLVDLWGFTDRKFRKPDEAEIKKTLKLIGSNKIILNFSNNMVKFMLSGMKIDLGGIAKGYALDCAVKKLKEAGIKNCLVNLGGQIYCWGTKSGLPRINPFGIIRGEAWKVAVQNPRGKDFQEILELEDKAVATSGDYEQYFIKNKKRYSHILDPKTGYPANSGIVSVTVIAPDGLTADALATAIFVLGKEKGMSVAGKFKGVCVYIIEE